MVDDESELISIYYGADMKRRRRRAVKKAEDVVRRL